MPSPQNEYGKSKDRALAFIKHAQAKGKQPSMRRIMLEARANESAVRAVARELGYPLPEPPARKSVHSPKPIIIYCGDDARRIMAEIENNNQLRLMRSYPCPFR